MNRIAQQYEGKEVRLYYDSSRILKVGDTLCRTDGLCFVINKVRQNKRGKHAGRWQIKAKVATKPPEGSTVHPFFWMSFKNPSTF